MRVAVRELKANLSKYLRLVKTSGKPIVITSRDTAIATLEPVADAQAPKLEQLQRQGLIYWNGGKPTGGRLRPKIRGKSVAETVLEDRG